MNTKNHSQHVNRGYQMCTVVAGSDGRVELVPKESPKF